MGQLLGALAWPEDAENARLRAALLKAEQERDAEKQERLAAEQRHLASELAGFIDRMRSISSSHSGDTLSNTDVILRGAPEAEEATLAAIFGDLPPVKAADAAAAWAALPAAHAAEWVQPPPPNSKSFNENMHVHPTIACVLRAALRPSATPLRLWCNQTAEHEVKQGTVRPDFTITHLRDAMPSTVGALLMVEVKKPGEIEDAVTQMGNYLRRRIYRLCKEAHTRKESMHALFALGVATDGQHVVVLRMHSGAPSAGSGQSFALAVPCPVLRSPLLPLLGDWDFHSTPPQWYRVKVAPEGFVVLARLLAAPVRLLAVDTLLTTHLEVHVGAPSLAVLSAASGASAAAVAAGGGSGLAGLDGRPCARLVLGERLGSGGTSDAYACSAEEGQVAEAAGGGAEGLCLKVARVSSPHVRGCFVQEASALQQLAAAGEGSATQAGLVPRLVAVCSRLGDPAWPLLLLQPAGKSLASWVVSRVHEEVWSSSSSSREGSGPTAAAAAAAAAVRARCATAVVLRILKALEAGNRMGLVHCDVRPSNIVMGPDGAVLVDWGISRAAGAESKSCGVAAYAHEHVFKQKTYAARPAQDVYAALLTWVCIARGSECAAPWTAGVAQLSTRREWLKARAACDAPVASVCQALEAVAQIKESKGERAARVYGIARKALEGL